MSNTESFIDEVTEEVRRDRLFALFRRYAWIAALAVIVLVGGAAFNEYRKAQARAQAEALGDSILAALESADDGARAAALSGISAEGPAAGVLTLLTAGAHIAEEDRDAALSALDGVASNGDMPELYRQLAAFKALVLRGSDMPVEDRRLAFSTLATPGAAFRLLAEEQLALLDIETGGTAAALDRLAAVQSDAEATAGLRRRATELIVALGGDPEAATAGTTTE